MLPSHRHTDLTRVIRLLKIVLRLQQRRSDERIGRAILAEECSTTIRSISRDIELLQNPPLSLPLTYDAATRTYLLAKSGWSLPVLSLTLEDVLALALARGLLSVPGFPHQDLVLPALDKATSGLPPALRAQVASAADALQTGPLARDYSHAPVLPLMDAAASRLTVEIYYQSRSGGHLAWRRVDPYEVSLRRAQHWEMHGWCHTRQGVRTFALDQVRQMRPTPAPFVRREPEWRSFREAAGIIGGLRGGPEVGVEVVFDPDVAAYVLDREWPKTLRLRPQGNGSVLMTGTVQGTDGILVELLAWRRHALVRGGPELRARMREEVAAMAGRYSDPCENSSENNSENNSEGKPE